MAAQQTLTDWVETKEYLESEGLDRDDPFGAARDGLRIVYVPYERVRMAGTGHGPEGDIAGAYSADLLFTNSGRVEDTIRRPFEFDGRSYTNIGGNEILGWHCYSLWTVDEYAAAALKPDTSGYNAGQEVWYAGQEYIIVNPAIIFRAEMIPVHVYTYASKKAKKGSQR
jgi:hypothetical protein